MELREIIKWVDDMNSNLDNAIFHYEEFGEDDWECFEGNRVVLDRALDNKDYPFILSSIVIGLDANNQKILFRRLFRNSKIFFNRCIIKKADAELYDSPPWSLNMSLLPQRKYLDIWDDFIITLEGVLLKFYTEVIQLCKECELDPMDFIIPEAKDVVNDIVEYCKLSPQEKYEKSLRLTKWQDYIIGAKKTQWEQLIADDISKARNRNGRLVATIITALQETGAIIHLGNRSKFYKYLKVDFPNLNSDTAIDNPLNGNSNHITQQEVEKVLKRLENYE